MKSHFFTLLSFCLIALSSFSQTPELVKDIQPGTLPCSAYDFTAYNGKVYFKASDVGYGDNSELWVTDGTEAGTQKVTEINPTGGSNPGNFTELNGMLYFTAYSSSVANNSLYATDGDTVYRVKDIGVYGLTTFNGKLYFRGHLATSTDDELWVSDGTEAGTLMVKDIFPGGSYTQSSYPFYFAEYNGLLYFIAQDSTNRYGLWKTDGTEAGTQKVKDIGSQVTYLKAAIGKLFFYSVKYLGIGYNAFWVSDGTEAGTQILQELNFPDNTLSYPVEMNGKVYFAASDTLTPNVEPWVTDGTVSGTQIVKDIVPPYRGCFLKHLTMMNGKLYFNAQDGFNGDEELWVTDGTDAGTYKVKDIAPGSASSFPSKLTVYNGRLYFVATAGSQQEQLWVTDGTEAGTQIVAGPAGTNVNDPLYFGHGIGNMRVADGSLYFSAKYDTAIGGELYKLTTPIYTSIVSPAEETSFNIYPNPASGELNVQGLQFEVGDEARIFDLLGKEVYFIGFSNTTSTIRIQISNMENGVYLVKVKSGGNFITRKLIIQH